MSRVRAVGAAVSRESTELRVPEARQLDELRGIAVGRVRPDGAATAREPSLPQLPEARHATARAWLRDPVGVCRIKLCGMSRDEDLTATNATRPDMVGFVTCFPRSHRSVELERLERLAAQVDERIWRVAVSVDLPVEQVARYANRCVDIVQLHGSEDDRYLRELRKRTDAGIIQAFRVRTAADVEGARRSSADLVLLDAGQGSGRTFDWTLIHGIGRPFVLAGGLTPDNVVSAIRDLRPWGVDLSSGIETDRVKDPRKMAAAVAAVRSVQ